jgi:hypothetical protein
MLSCYADALAQLTGELVNGDVDRGAGSQALVDQRQKLLLFLCPRADGGRAGVMGHRVFVGEEVAEVIRRL